jgi:nitrile hydratase
MQGETGRGVHDLGGAPGDEPVDREEHEPHAFEKRVGALLRLLSHPDKRVMRVDELRRGIESLNETEYAGYAYYERWVESIRRILVEKGVVSEAELLRKIAEVRQRLQGSQPFAPAATPAAAPAPGRATPAAPAPRKAARGTAPKAAKSAKPAQRPAARRSAAAKKAAATRR